MTTRTLYALALLGATALGAAAVRCAPEGFTFADGSITGDGGDLDANTAQCEGGLQAVADDQAVWVSGSMGDDSAGCTRVAPCKTISAALAKAQPTWKSTSAIWPRTRI